MTLTADAHRGWRKHEIARLARHAASWCCPLCGHGFTTFVPNVRVVYCVKRELHERAGWIEMERNDAGGQV